MAVDRVNRCIRHGHGACVCSTQAYAQVQRQKLHDEITGKAKVRIVGHYYDEARSMAPPRMELAASDPSSGAQRPLLDLTPLGCSHQLSAICRHAMYAKVLRDAVIGHFYRIALDLRHHDLFLIACGVFIFRSSCLETEWQQLKAMQPMRFT